MGTLLHFKDTLCRLIAFCGGTDLICGLTGFIHKAGVDHLDISREFKGVCVSIVCAHSGLLSLQSVVGQWLNLHLWLPLEQWLRPLQR
jgi:hypothetical protein